MSGLGQQVGRELEWRDDAALLPARTHTVVPVSQLHLPTARALAYARATRPDTLTALTVDIDDADTLALQEEWKRRRVPVPLTVIESPYREITRPVLQYVKDLRQTGPRDVVTVFIPEYVVGRWWEQLLHNQSALRLKARLLFQPGVMVTSVPWQLDSARTHSHETARRPGPTPQRRGSNSRWEDAEQMRDWTTNTRTDDWSPGGRIRLSTRRRVAGLVLSGVLLPVLTALLVPFRDTVDLTTDVLAFLLAVVAVASVGGLWPALVAAVGSSLLLNYYFTAPLHRFAVDNRDDAIALAAFIAVAAAVSAAGLRQRRLADAAASAALLAEADRTRAALLTAVSHDLRSPLASAKTAVSALTADDLTWTHQQRTELLATADESLDRLTRLVENLLDMSRLQAGALAVHPTAMGVDDVLPAVLTEFGHAGRRVELQVPPDLPELLADPGLLERILANLLGNALRHSPPDRPPRVSATTTGDRIELRIADSGPGVSETEWDRIFVPFQRLGDRTTGAGVGLGLALSRGLAEAMGGTLRPDRTPGGGLTMVLSLPAAPAASPRTPDPETVR